MSSCLPMKGGFGYILCQNTLTCSESYRGLILPNEEHRPPKTEELAWAEVTPARAEESLRNIFQLGQGKVPDWAGEKPAAYAGDLHACGSLVLSSLSMIVPHLAPKKGPNPALEGSLPFPGRGLTLMKWGLVVEATSSKPLLKPK